MRDKKVIPEIYQMGIIVATEIVEIEMEISKEKMIIGTIKDAVGKETTPMGGKDIDHPLKTVTKIGEIINTTIPLHHLDGQQIRMINSHQDLIMETLEDHMNRQDITREAPLGPIEMDKDHPNLFRETEIDQGIGDLDDVVTLVHTQEVLIEGTEKIDLLAETIIGDKDKA